MMTNIFKLAKNGFSKVSFIVAVSLFSSGYADVNEALRALPSVSAVVQEADEALVPYVDADLSVGQEGDENAFSCTEIESPKQDVSFLSVCCGISGCVRDISSIGCSLFSGIQSFLNGYFFVPQNDTFDNLSNIKAAYQAIVSLKGYKEQEGDKLENLVNLCVNGSRIINGLLSLGGFVCEHYYGFNLFGWLGVAQQCLLRADTICVMASNLAVLPSICGRLFQFVSSVFC